MLERKRVNVEKSIGKLSQNALFSDFPKIFIAEGNFCPEIHN